MAPRAIVLSPEAQTRLDHLQDWIAKSNSEATAERFCSALLTRPENLRDFPQQGTARDELRAGLRTLGFRGRVTIAFAVTQATVDIVGIIYAGQDLEGLLSL